MLFAFLLAVPFSARWEASTTLQRDVFFATLLLTALATVLLMTPAALHRMRFQQADKPHIVQAGRRLVLAGISVLALAMTSAVFLITDVLFSVPAAIGVAGTLLVVVLAVWFALPLSRRFARPEDAAGARSRPAASDRPANIGDGGPRDRDTCAAAAGWPPPRA